MARTLRLRHQRQAVQGTPYPTYTAVHRRCSLNATFPIAPAVAAELPRSGRCAEALQLLSQCHPLMHPCVPICTLQMWRVTECTSVEGIQTFEFEAHSDPRPHDHKSYTTVLYKRLEMVVNVARTSVCSGKCRLRSIRQSAAFSW